MVSEIKIYNVERYLIFNPITGLEDSLSNDFLSKLKNIPLQDELNVNNRLLDQISKDIYGTELLWWVIQYYNDILDPLDITLSKVQVPSKTDLDNFLISYVSSNA